MGTKMTMMTTMTTMKMMTMTIVVNQKDGDEDNNENYEDVADQKGVWPLLFSFPGFPARYIHSIMMRMTMMRMMMIKGKRQYKMYCSFLAIDRIS